MSRLHPEQGTLLRHAIPAAVGRRAGTFGRRQAGADRVPEDVLTPMTDYEYIVVGAGPGGGTLAARLAENGFRVLLLEAGGDPLCEEGTNPNPNSTGQNTLPEDYKVPAFHAQASENSGMKWDFYVRHYANDAEQKKDSKYVPKED